MNEITIYTDVSSLFDLRRGVLTHLARENGHPDFKWDLFDPIYQKRRMDYFIREDLGITPDGYNDRLKKVTIDDWADENECYFYPTYLHTEMLQIVRAIEFGDHQCVTMDKLSMVINIYPFDFSEELSKALIDTLANSFRIPVSINLMSVPDSQLTAPFLNSYNFVFKYDLLIGKNSEQWLKTVANVKNLGTKYIVPELLAREYTPEVKDKLEEVSIKDHINKCSMVLGGAVIFIPVDKRLYQYYIPNE